MPLEWEDPTFTIEGIRELLCMVAETDFGRAIKMPTRAEIESMDDEQQRHGWADLVAVSSALYFRLHQSWVSTESGLSVMPEYFSGFNTLMNLGDCKHPLNGFIGLKLINHALSTAPIGTQYQLKEELLEQIKAIPTNPKVTMYDFISIMNDVNHRLAVYGTRGPGSPVNLQNDVVYRLLQSFTMVCRKIYMGSDSGKHKLELVDMAESTAQHLRTWGQTPGMTWQSFQAQLSVVLQTSLPTQPAQAAGKGATNALALAAFSTGSTGKHGRDAPPWWICENCGDNHYSQGCTRPHNPKAAKLIEKTRKERAEKTELMHKQRMQRKRAREASDALAERDKGENDGEKPTPKKQDTNKAKNAKAAVKFIEDVRANMAITTDENDERTVYISAQAAQVYAVETDHDTMVVDTTPLCNLLCTAVPGGV